MLRRPLALLVFFGAIAVQGTWAAPAGFIAPTKTDKCPVCGMFVARYQDWLAEIVFTDGSYVVFDGAKDLFRFRGDMERYLPSARGKQIRAIWVTDYYSLDPIDGSTAFYAVGSDVYGPMGKELIPFGSRSDAEGFLADHKGKRIVRIAEVPDVLPGILE